MTDQQAFREIFALMDALAEAESDSAEMDLRDRVRSICEERIAAEE